MHRRNRIFIFVLMSKVLIFFSGCAGFQTKVTSGIWDSFAYSEDLVVIGVSERQQKREMEIQNAVNDAAFKVALFYGLSAKVYVAAANGSSFWDYMMESDSEFIYNNDYKKYIDGLRYDTSRDTLSIDGALLLRTRYKVSGPIPSKHRFKTFKTIDGKPQWIKKPPSEIAGFLSGIGYAGVQSKLSNTILKAYQNAIASIVRRIATTSFTYISTVDGMTYSKNVQVSSGSLIEFFAYDLWRDPSTNGVWILALAKKK